ncbi:hypothetical protein LMG33818_002203 [Halomonadaceae bacterium LMG 33818]|uniref:hypothetical protein n=1 Tax=Cernens ardua TaxID=3402176 RepID=UPI003EDCAA0E
MDSFSSAPMPLSSVLTLHTSLVESESLAALPEDEAVGNALLGAWEAESAIEPGRIPRTSLAQRDINILPSNQPLSLGPTSGIQLGRMGSRNLKTLSNKLKIKISAGASIDELLEETGGDAALLADVLAQEEGDEEDRKKRQAYSRLLLSQYGSQVSCNDLVENHAQTSSQQELRGFFHDKLWGDASSKNLLGAMIKFLGDSGLPTGFKELRHELNRRLGEQSLGARQALYSQQLDFLVISTSIRLVNAWRGCHELISFMQINDKPTASALLQRILEMIDEGLSGDSIKSLYISIGGNQGAYRHRMSIFNYLITLFRRLPLVMWKTESDRQNDMTMLLTVMGLLTSKVPRNALPTLSQSVARGITHG